MQPVSSSLTVYPALRPHLSLGADLPSVLHEGSIVTGEVIETLSGSSIVLGIGGERVPAETQVQLALGQRFLARVVNVDGKLMLKLIPELAAEDQTLLEALRRVVGDDLPAGALLERLDSALAALSSKVSPGDQKAIEALREMLRAHAFTPSTDGAGLAERVRVAGLAPEAVLARLEDGQLTTPELVTLARETVNGWMRALTTALGGDALPLNLVTLHESLEELVLDFARSANRTSPEALAELSEKIASRLHAAVADTHLTPADRVRVQTALATIQPAWLARNGDSFFRALVGALPDDLLRGLLRGLAQGRLQTDLKTQLLRVSSVLESGAARDVVGHALAGIEAEQLMNVARAHSGDPRHVSLAMLEAGAWSTLHLLIDPDANAREQARDERRSSETTDQRLTLGVEFSRVGPVRADIRLGKDHVGVRLSVGSAAISERLTAGLEHLRELLTIGGRRADIVIVERTFADSQLERFGGDVRYLHDHHLMDLSG